MKSQFWSLKGLIEWTQAYDNSEYQLVILHRLYDLMLAFPGRENRVKRYFEILRADSSYEYFQAYVDGNDGALNINDDLDYKSINFRPNFFSDDFHICIDSFKGE